MKIILFLALFLHPAIRPVQDIYSLSFTTIDGRQRQMVEFKGKKILIVVLPGAISQSDTALLKSLRTTKTDFADELTILAVPSAEAGSLFVSRALSSWYRQYAGNGVILLQGMSTRKAAGAQSELFKWLTDKDRNGHFDADVEGPGQKFFISETGELYAVYGPTATLSPALLRATFLQTKSKPL